MKKYNALCYFQNDDSEIGLFLNFFVKKIIVLQKIRCPIKINWSDVFFSDKNRWCKLTNCTLENIYVSDFCFPVVIVIRRLSNWTTDASDALPLGRMPEVTRNILCKNTIKYISRRNVEQAK
jgi:hypothetical protein